MLNTWLAISILAGIFGCGADEKEAKREKASPTHDEDNADANTEDATKPPIDSPKIEGKKIIFVDPGAASVGDPLTITVNAVDSFGNLATTLDGEVQVNTGGGATRSGSVPIRAGVGSVIIQDDVAETIRIDLSDPVPENLNVTDTIDVTFVHDKAAKIVIGDVPETMAGTLLSATITAVDEFGNIDKDYQGSIDLVATGNAQVQGPVTIKNGEGVGKILDNKAEVVTLTLDDSGNSGLDIKSTKTYAVVPNVASKFVMQPIPDTKINTPVTIEIQVHDSLGNLVTNYSGEVIILASSNTVTGAGPLILTGGKGSISIMNSVEEAVAFQIQDPNNTGLGRNFQTANFTK